MLGMLKSNSQWRLLRPRTALDKALAAERAPMAMRKIFVGQALIRYPYNAIRLRNLKLAGWVLNYELHEAE